MLEGWGKVSFSHMSFFVTYRPLSYGMRRPQGFDFTNPGVAFDEILVVSLDRHAGRFARVAALLDGLGLTNYRRWEAFDASKPGVHEKMKLQIGAKMTGTGSGWSLGAIGCAESHWEIFEHVHEEAYGRALILEDDIVFNPNANLSLLLEAIHQIPDDAEIAYLGYCFSRTHEFVKPLWKHGAACCTHAYVLSHFGAARLLQLLQPLSAPIDEVMRDLCYSGQINCYIAHIGVGNRHPDFLHDGLFLQTVSKGT